MLKLKLPKKISFSRERLAQFLIKRIGGLFLAFFFVIFSLGLFVFWKYAWSISYFDLSAAGKIPAKALPRTSLENSLQYLEHKENDFNSPLFPLSIRDPFQ